MSTSALPLLFHALPPPPLPAHRQQEKKTGMRSSELLMRFPFLSKEARGGAGIGMRILLKYFRYDTSIRKMLKAGMAEVPLAASEKEEGSMLIGGRRGYTGWREMKAHTGGIMVKQPVRGCGWRAEIGQRLKRIR